MAQNNYLINMLSLNKWMTELKNNFNAKKENHLLANSLCIMLPNDKWRICHHYTLPGCLFELSKALISYSTLPSLNHLLPSHIYYDSQIPKEIQNLFNNALFESVQNCKCIPLFGYLISAFICIMFSLFKEPA